MCRSARRVFSSALEPLVNLRSDFVGVRFSPAADTHAMTDRCFKLRCMFRWIVRPLADTAIQGDGIRDLRSSHSEMPTSLRLQTSSVGRPCTYWPIHLSISSSKQRRTSRRCAPRGHSHFPQSVQVASHEGIGLATSCGKSATARTMFTDIAPSQSSAFRGIPFNLHEDLLLDACGNARWRPRLSGGSTPRASICLTRS
jgi:hypothetical protein